MNRWVEWGPSWPPASNSAVYCVNRTPTAGAVWTIAVHFTMPGSGARTNVSGVSSK